jgi:hypothetical protein
MVLEDLGHLRLRRLDAAKVGERCGDVPARCSLSG